MTTGVLLLGGLGLVIVAARALRRRRIERLLLTEIASREGEFYVMDLVRPLSYPGVGDLYALLARLERDGVIASRWQVGVPAEILKIRGGLRRRVYWVRDRERLERLLAARRGPFARRLIHES